MSKKRSWLMLRIKFKASNKDLQLTQYTNELIGRSKSSKFGLIITFLRLNLSFLSYEHQRTCYN